MCTVRDGGPPIEWEQLPKLYVREPQPLRVAQFPKAAIDKDAVAEAAPFAGVPNEPPHICQGYVDSALAADLGNADSLPPACAYIARGDGSKNVVPSPSSTGRPTPVAKGRLTVS